ncbi:MAG: hypothetical protein NVS9B13_22260 [Candidatus Acidiferrum sp.]
MSTLQNSNAFDLLGQSVIASCAVRLPGRGGPRLEIAWGTFHHSLASSLKTLFDGTRAPKEFLGANYFRDCWIERRIPHRALLAAILWHVAFILLSPIANLNLSPQPVEALENAELTWSGPITDLPLLNISSSRPKAAPHDVAGGRLEAKTAESFHPRQHIFTDSMHPTHPRLTLINSVAPPDAPRILPNLPNFVQIQQMAGPARPRLEISEMTLLKLRPREKKRAFTVTDAPPPNVVNFEQRPADMNFATAQSAPAKPKLLLNSGAAPRIVPRTQSGNVEPAPEVSDPQSGIMNGPSSTFIALSASPAPPLENIVPPQGNLSAPIALSPEGKQQSTAGDPASSPLSVGQDGAGKNSMTVSVNGGNRSANNVVSGIGAANISAPQPHLLFNRPEPKSQSEEIPQRTGPPNFATLPPGAKPEEIFAAKHVYSLNANMPNLNSATGSWILNFSEMSAAAGGSHANAADLAGPVPIRKVDPKYPRTLMNEHVEGEVILYAVIRSDGTVDSIQLVRGIDEQLDANAMSALSQWKFHPAKKNGVPLDLEAIVHIPFRGPATR